MTVAQTLVSVRELKQSDLQQWSAYWEQYQAFYKVELSKATTELTWARFFDPAEPGTATIVKRGGQRVGTLVMYLNTPEKGGGTTFPDVHLEVGPQRGNAVFFSYERPHTSTRTLHGGAPVIAGEKWIATKWLREREFK